MSASDLAGLVREVPRTEPPRRWMALTSLMASRRCCSGWPRTSHLKPSRKPMTSNPCSTASMATELITPSMHQEGPQQQNRHNITGPDITHTIYHPTQHYRCSVTPQQT